MKTLLEILGSENEPDIITQIIDDKMKRRLFHLTHKSTGEHKYYGSLAAIFLDNENLGISKFSLDRYDFDTSPFENENCIIRKGFMLSTGDIRSASK